MNRIDNIFNVCRCENRAALIIFVEAGYPTSEAAEAAAESAIASGADLIELGVPFSDPMADGPVICEASHAALAGGANLSGVIKTAANLRRRHPETGIILFSYMNPLLNYGYPELCADLRGAGVDGLLAVDLPLEEREELSGSCRAENICLIPLVAPNTPPERMKAICAGAEGFVYYISVCGTTGGSNSIDGEAAARLKILRSIAAIPVAVGFGIADADSAAAAAQTADGVIVGSAFVRTQADGPEAGAKLVRTLRHAVAKNTPVCNTGPLDVY